MADNNEQKGTKIETQMEIKVEPTIECYADEEQSDYGFPGFDNSGAIPSTADVGALNLWTSKATNCLISQYKKYRSMVGQSTQIRSLREMFEMISLEMQNYGFYFSPQKCENKWRVLERKYKNLVFRERLKKPGRMRHYGHWEHKRALDEIFNEKKRRAYLEENDLSLPAAPTKFALVLPKSPEVQSDDTADKQDTLSAPSLSLAEKKNDEPFDERTVYNALFEKFLEEIGKNFASAERNKERRHKEKMALWQSELEIQKKLLKMEEQKIELQKSQIIAAAQHLHLNI